MISHFISFIRVFISLNFFLKTHIYIFCYFCIFLYHRGGCHWQGTATGPKSHTSRSKMPHWSVIIRPLTPRQFYMANTCILIRTSIAFVPYLSDNETCQYSRKHTILTPVVYLPGIGCFPNSYRNEIRTWITINAIASTAVELNCHWSQAMDE